MHQNGTAHFEYVEVCQVNGESVGLWIVANHDCVLGAFADPDANDSGRHPGHRVTEMDGGQFSGAGQTHVVGRGGAGQQFLPGAHMAMPNCGPVGQ